MTDEDMLENLREILDIITTGDWHGGHIDALEAAILKLQPTPPPPGSVAVRIAVAVGSYAVVARPIGKLPGRPLSEPIGNMKAIDNARFALDEDPIAEAIITAHIPPRTVPEVSATVEAFDPEATI